MSIALRYVLACLRAYWRVTFPWGRSAPPAGEVVQVDFRRGRASWVD